MELCENKSRGKSFMVRLCTERAVEVRLESDWKSSGNRLKLDKLRLNIVNLKRSFYCKYSELNH
jgi:hypothetical protein